MPRHPHRQGHFRSVSECVCVFARETRHSTEFPLMHFRLKRENGSIQRMNPEMVGRMIDLRTPSVDYNHGGYYGPADPRDCTMPNGPCGVCSEMLEAAKTLVAFSQQRTCKCGGTIVPHPDPQCNTCDAEVCMKCMHGCRYFCRLVRNRRTQKS